VIILPERGVCRTRLLLPVQETQWREPSQAQPKDCFGNANCTRFRVRARLNDGSVRWRGFFDIRDDFDAFLWAIANDTLRLEPGLWRLPTPAWHPDLGKGTSFDFATLTFLTSPTGSNQNWTVPFDWNSASNFIDALGGGASGGAGQPTGTSTGGAGGGWARLNNVSLTPNATQVYFIGGGGAAASTGGGNVNGNNGVNSWLRIDGGSTAPGSTSNGVLGCGSNAGLGGASNTATNGGTSPGGSVGNSTNNGGRGGNLTGTVTGLRNSSGGGGAGGPNGAGNTGTDAANPSGTNTNGGSGDAGSGGSAGANSAGGNGTEWDGSHGSGGGGSGDLSAGRGRAGGNYGGGGGGNADASGTVPSGAGIQGIIAISYTPTFRMAFNSPMLGM
jgi:hypothetical protein